MTQTPAFYPTLDANPNFAAIESEILDFWRENNVFTHSVSNRPARKADGSSNAYVFYDGPPFANGLPHYGHLLTGYVKDAIARYHTMAGRRVERRFGWDCHGLPAEMGAEKDLGISGRAAITNYGIGKFNEHCRTSVMHYTQDWEYYVTRQGRWVDFKNDYKTMDTPFMESCVWAFSELYKKGLIYESMRVMPYSWAAETPVSNFETRLDNATREREDKAAYVKFKLKEKPQGAPEAENYYLIAWTTTPWTLPSNLALAVHAGMEYGMISLSEAGKAPSPAGGGSNPEGIRGGGNSSIHSAADLAALEHPPEAADAPSTPRERGMLGASLYFVAQSAAEKMAETLKGEVVGTQQGADLLDLTYEPLFPYFADTPNAFRVLDGSDFVTDGDGTGIVHMAPGFGEVDQACCAKNGIETLVPVDEKGRFTDAIFDLPDLKLAGLTVVADTRIAEADLVIAEEDKAQHIAAKDVAKYGLANMRIVRWLKANGKLVKDEPCKHNYPHCWRTDTPLIYRAMSSWYVNVQAIKANMAANNETIHWIPDHVQQGQMGKGIESAPDWSISRNRFWGTPIPIWKSPSGKIIVPSSIAEIEQWSGQKVPDLHRPYIDAITFERDGETYTRIEDVFDCWFESGSMPYAQVHYPFENKDWFEENFPADFITEYIAQTRGWFYTLQVLSAALFGKAPFKNCICHGVVIDEETGLKYSKRLKNYRDPKEVMEAYGADALRWMMLASPVMRGADLGVDPDGKFIRDVVRLTIKPLWSAYNFFCLYANADGVKAKLVVSRQSSVTSENRSPLVGEPHPPSDVVGGENLLDRYILAKCRATVEAVRAGFEAYDTPSAADAITAFFDVLNNWYIRRSRARFWGTEMTADKQAAYDTLYTVLTLMCRAAAPLLPFTTEAVYRGLVGHAATHSDPSPASGGSHPPLRVWGGVGTDPDSTRDPIALERAQELRQNPTEPEKRLWNALADKRLEGAKFRRQHTIGKYIVDFACLNRNLIIELDGESHAHQAGYDAARTAYLESQHFRVIRFWNHEVMENLEGVLTRIVEALEHPPEAADAPSTPRERGMAPSLEASASLDAHSAPSPACRARSNPEGIRGGVISVHLTDFPDVSRIAQEKELIADMDWVQEICNAGSAVRNKQNIRNRQPLSELGIYGEIPVLKRWFITQHDTDVHRWHYMRELISDELNVKSVEAYTLPENFDQVATRKLVINSQILGKRLPAKMKEILPASKKGAWEYASEQGGILIAGELLKAADGEYNILLEPKPEYKDSAQAAGDNVVVLDLTLTPELEAEGRARDLVRMIQQARKDAGLHVGDRIALALDVPAPFEAALAAHGAYIAEQVLAVSIGTGAGSAAQCITQELDGESFTIGLTKIAA